MSLAEHPALRGVSPDYLLGLLERLEANVEPPLRIVAPPARQRRRRDRPNAPRPADSPYFALVPDALIRDRRLTDIAVRVYALFVLEAPKNDGDVLGRLAGQWAISYHQVGEALGVSDATAKRALCDLVRYAWMTRRHRPGRSTLYQAALAGKPRI